MKKALYLSAILAIALSCATEKETEQKAKFEPEDGQCYIFAGQTIPSVGGLDEFNNGYCDYFEAPAGITYYMDMGTPNDTMASLSEYEEWNEEEHVINIHNKGEYLINKYLVDDTFDGCMFAVGLILVGGEELVLSGKKDSELEKLGNWLNSLNGKPVFLRVGFEFDGFEWNHYVKETYLPMYRYIVDYLRGMNVTNVAYVWQSKGWDTTVEEFEEWYPGDDYVDWCAYSHFDTPDDEMIKFARLKGKPLMIAEATPNFKVGDKFTDSDIKKPEIARKMWDEWYTNLFKLIEDNGDVIKALAYINTDWYAQDAWVNVPQFQQIDSRIEMSPYVSEKWKEKIAEPRYLNLKEIKGKF